MFNFTSKYPAAKNVGNSTKGLTKSKISENVNQAKQSALDIMEDIGDAILDKITSAIDGVIDSITSVVESVVESAINTVKSVINTVESIVDAVSNAYDSVKEYLTSDSDDNAVYIKKLSTDSEIDELLGINDYIDNTLVEDEVTAENGTVQKSLLGSINNLTKTLTNRDKRDISQYTDKKLEKIQEIKKQCTEDLVKYAVEMSDQKFMENSDTYDNVGIDMSNLGYSCINIKTIKVVITSDEQ